MNVSGPPIVAAGSSADVAVDWSNLAPQQIYLGAISHNTPQGVSGLTIVEVRN